MKPGIQNCAIYTRKSTEEGLEQAFNSLDAQREACAAYIMSQKAEGWRTLPEVYDDGGYSGGNIERPALQRLLEDIRAGKVNIIVVYKIDRLTRALSDFAKLVDIFDAYDVTFVSVTQSFNTTTSMGRLTLNVLLSFAQFEREVTSERIRDKIAASKKRGMWMGGHVPLGYRLEERRLIVDSDEAVLVQKIFAEYLQLGAVKALKRSLDQQGMRTPAKISKKGQRYGQAPFSAGHLYKILKNPLYRGQIQHKGTIYEGEHEGIIEPDIFNRVQELLASNRIKRKEKIVKSGSVLQGVLFDEDETVYSPTYTAREKKRYYYYISQNLLQFKDHPKGRAARLPAHDIEQTVREGVELYLEQNLSEVFPFISEDAQGYIKKQKLKFDNQTLRSLVSKVVYQQENLHIELNPSCIKEFLETQWSLSPGVVAETVTFEIPYKLRRVNNGAWQSSQRKILSFKNLPSEEIQRIVRGTIWREEHFAGRSIEEISKIEQHSHHYIRRCIYDSLNYLSV